MLASHYVLDELLEKSDDPEFKDEFKKFTEKYPAT